MTKKMRITSSNMGIVSDSWLLNIREQGGIFYVRISDNVIGCWWTIVRGPSGFFGEPHQTKEIPEDPKDYFKVIPVDAGGNVIESMIGFVHLNVLAYMNDVGPEQDGYYLLYTLYGHIMYKLFEDWGLSIALPKKFSWHRFDSHFSNSKLFCEDFCPYWKIPLDCKVTSYPIVLHVDNKIGY